MKEKIKDYVDWMAQTGSTISVNDCCLRLNIAFNRSNQKTIGHIFRQLGLRKTIKRTDGKAHKAWVMRENMASKLTKANQ